MIFTALKPGDRFRLNPRDVLSYYIKITGQGWGQDPRVHPGTEVPMWAGHNNSVLVAEDGTVLMLGIAENAEVYPIPG